MMAKEQGVQMPVYQVLIYPVSAVSKMDTVSYQENAEAKPLNKAMMAWFGKHTLAKPEDAQNPRLSLLLAGDALKAMPPTTIILAQIDPLRSEGAKLAEPLQQAGVKVNLKTYEGVTHEFFGMAAVMHKAQVAQTVVAADLRAAFGQ